MHAAHMDSFLQQFTKQADALQAADSENARRELLLQQDGARYHHPNLRSQLPDDAVARMLAARPDIFYTAFLPTAQAVARYSEPQQGSGPCLGGAVEQRAAAVQQAARPGAIQLGTRKTLRVTLSEERLVRVWVQEKAARDKHGGNDFVLRLYTAASASRFWRHSESLPQERRHCYELLREGRPCHLYFDLEFAKDVNESVDGDAAVLRVLEITRALAGCACAVVRASLHRVCISVHSAELLVSNICSASNGILGLYQCLSCKRRLALCAGNCGVSILQMTTFLRATRALTSSGRAISPCAFPAARLRRAWRSACSSKSICCGIRSLKK